MKVIPRIHMNENCREAIELYKSAFGATVDNISTFGDAKVGTDEHKDLIINSQIDLGGSKFHIADSIRTEVVSGNQTSFTIIMESAEEVKTAFEKIKVGGSVMIEPSPTFFSPCHCGVTDKFGVTWQINCLK